MVSTIKSIGTRPQAFASVSDFRPSEVWNVDARNSPLADDQRGVVPMHPLLQSSILRLSPSTSPSRGRRALHWEISR